MIVEKGKENCFDAVKNSDAEQRYKTPCFAVSAKGTKTHLSSISLSDSFPHDMAKSPVTSGFFAFFGDQKRGWISLRKKPQETGREHGKEIGKHKPIGTAAGRYRMGCDAEKTIKIHDQDNWTKQDHGRWTLTTDILVRTRLF